MPHVPIRHTHGAGGPARGAAFGQFSDSESLGDHNLKFSERLRGSREVLTAGFPSPDPGAGICEYRCCIGGFGVAGGAPPVVLFCYAARYFVTQAAYFVTQPGEFVTRQWNLLRGCVTNSDTTLLGLWRQHRGCSACIGSMNTRRRRRAFVRAPGGSATYCFGTSNL